MGVEIAKALRNAGSEVHLVLGGECPVPKGIDTFRVRSAQPMLEACLALWPDMEGVIAAAAVADQRPEHFSDHKVKKQDGPEQLILVRTPDVLATLSKARRPGQWAIGFAAESENHMANALQKLENKGLEAVFL